MDGKFMSAPSIMLQLYTIHVNVQGEGMPVVMTLMERKTREAYETLFRVLKRKVGRHYENQLNPRFISIDYEVTVINVIKSEFDGVKVAGCLFHLAQSFWRRPHTEGLVQQYNVEENSELRALFHSLVSLAFVPVENVHEAFDQLQETVEGDLIQVFDFLEDNYIKGRRRGRGRQQPLIAPDTWNCYDRLEVEEVDRCIERLEGGHSPTKKKRKYIDLDRRISRIVEEYPRYKAEGTVIWNLRALGLNLAGHF
ncbi:hypothetical protein ANN_17650 [Periplaneta americana]|uniref:MULE transposase domain-containing protein n=1 Tax=Periplaneta americana TaxID=6978 RepID=A0ABQ8SVN2_PERAM|nr:hypothetical protein ANN_17650 [Periplaneta americana]